MKYLIPWEDTATPGEERMTIIIVVIIWRTVSVLRNRVLRQSK